MALNLLQSLQLFGRCFTRLPLASLCARSAVTSSAGRGELPAALGIGPPGIPERSSLAFGVCTVDPLPTRGPLGFPPSFSSSRSSKSNSSRPFDANTSYSDLATSRSACQPLFLPTVNSMRKPLLSAKVVIYSMMSIGFHQRSLRARRHHGLGPPGTTLRAVPQYPRPSRQQCRAGIFSPLPGPRPPYRTRQRAQEFRMALACSLSRLGLLRRPIFRLAATPYAGRLPSQQSQQLFLPRSSSPFFSA